MYELYDLLPFIGAGIIGLISYMMKLRLSERIINCPRVFVVEAK